MEFVCGIDGGGTKTTMVCWTLEGATLLSRTYGPFNINSIGVDAFASLLKTISGDLNQLGVCKSLVIGAAGSSNRTMNEIISQVLDEYGIKTWKLVGDHEIGLTGSLDGKEGISVISGTGSIVFGKGKDNRLERSGGWGHLIGDDGSGYGLGRDAFRAVAKAMDTSMDQTILTQIIADKLNLKTRADIITYVYNNDKSAVAALAVYVEEAATLGDKVAQGIIKANAEALVMNVKAVSDKLSLGPCNVSMLGGLLSHQTNMRRTFINLMAKADKTKTCIDPIHDGAIGAVMMALEVLDA